MSESKSKCAIGYDVGTLADTTLVLDANSSLKIIG